MHLMKYSKYLMLLGGVWRLPHFKNPKYHFIYTLYGVFLLISMCTVCTLMFVKFFYFLKVKDVKQLTANVRIAITCSLACIKSIIYQNGTFQKFIKMVIEEEEKILRSDDEKIIEIYNRFVRYVDKCALAIVVLAGGTAGFLVFATAVIGLTMKKDEKPMILLAQFPFNQLEHYKLSLLIQGASVFIALIYYYMSQVFYITILTFVKIQLKILTHQFKNFDEYKEKILPPIGDMGMVKKLIKKHQFIIRFVTELNRALRMLMLIEFLLSSLNIASVTFQLIAAQSITDLNFFFSHLIVLIGQLFIMAWHANDVSIESLEIARSVYESPWYEKNNEVKNIMKLVVFRAQKPLVLTIGPFTPLSTQTIIAVINAAYSYVTLMTSNY